MFYIKEHDDRDALDYLVKNVRAQSSKHSDPRALLHTSNHTLRAMLDSHQYSRVRLITLKDSCPALTHTIESYLSDLTERENQSENEDRRSNSNAIFSDPAESTQDMNLASEPREKSDQNNLENISKRCDSTDTTGTGLEGTGSGSEKGSGGHGSEAASNGDADTREEKRSKKRNNIYMNMNNVPGHNLVGMFFRKACHLFHKESGPCSRKLGCNKREYRGSVCSYVNIRVIRVY